MGMRTINKLNITFLLSLICLQLSAEIRCKTYSTAYMHALRSILISIFLFVYAQFGLAQVFGVVEPTACPTDFYSVYYGNHRAVSVLGQLSGGKISPDVIVGTWRGGQPLTAGQLSNLFFSGKLGSCNRNYRGLPWVDVFKAKDICDNFDPKLLTSIDGLQEGQAIVLIEGTPGQVDYRKIRARLGCESMPVCDLVDNLGRGVQFIDADGNLIPQGKQVPSLASPPRGPAPHAQTPTVGRMRGSFYRCCSNPSWAERFGNAQDACTYGQAGYSLVEQAIEEAPSSPTLSIVKASVGATLGAGSVMTAANVIGPAAAPVAGGAATLGLGIAGGTVLAAPLLVLGAFAEEFIDIANTASDEMGKCSDLTLALWRKAKRWCENNSKTRAELRSCVKVAGNAAQDAFAECLNPNDFSKSEEHDIDFISYPMLR